MTRPTSRNAQVISYGRLSTPAPSDQELAELRRQQAALANATRKLDAQYGWLAIPAIAAPWALVGLEGAALWGARAALPEIEQAPLDFVERDPYLRVGDNWRREQDAGRMPRWKSGSMARMDGNMSLG